MNQEAKSSVKGGYAVTARVLVLVSFILLIAATGCVYNESGYGAAENAINTHRLMIPDDVEESVFETAVAQTRLLYMYTTLPIRIHGPVMEELRFEQYGGSIYEIPVFTGQMVNEGDVLAVLHFDPVPLEAELLQLEMQLDLHRRQTATIVSNHRRALADARSYQTEQEDLQAVVIDRLILEHQIQLFNRQPTEEWLLRRIDEVNERLTGDTITAPFDGFVFYVTALRQGADNAGRPVIIRIADTRFLYFHSTSAKGILRHGDVVTVTDERSGLTFDTRVVSDPIAIAPEITRATHQFLLAPYDIDIFLTQMHEYGFGYADLDNLRLTVSVLLFYEPDAVYVPIQAVHSSHGRYFVYLYENGVLSRVYVVTGVRYMSFIQIVSGINHGQIVVV